MSISPKQYGHFIHAVKLFSVLYSSFRSAFATALLAVLFSHHALASDLQTQVDSLLGLEPVKGSSWSVMFSELESGKEIASYDAERLLIPASVTKIWTTAAAFDSYGPDYKFITKFISPSTIDGQGALNGKIQVVCGGDPMFDRKYRRDLGKPALEKVSDELYAKGLRRVNGDLEIVVNRFERSCGNGVWEMGDLREGFAPAVDGAGYNSNVCHVAIGPGLAEGDSAEVIVDPPFAPISVINAVVTASNSNESWVEFNVTPCRDELEITGVMARGDDPQYIWFPIQNPAHYFGLALREALGRKGITVSGQVVVSRNVIGTGNSLLEFASPPLIEIANITNKDSDNYLAEYLLSAVGQREFGEGSTEAGIRAVQKFAREIGIHRDQVSLQDGAGLSRQNIVSALANVQLLTKMAKSESANAFESSLAQSGIDGTIGGRLATDGMMGRVRAKTGTMTNVSSLAGYMALDNGKKIVFAILCNNFRCSRNFVRNIQDNLVRAVYRATN